MLLTLTDVHCMITYLILLFTPPLHCWHVKRSATGSNAVCMLCVNKSNNVSVQRL
ncbi:hypothetical protein BDQ12DRAFT_685748 [Crucibulum laeve]|uniref:Uncharacterized protein n=1 Tax=Crucibulum laeve TaxID=68775 RepID=A0A5C3LYU5_9AGAR|nr:hypothetical protein BDQ12DRAFT_685748 [Crucibulum laeve]